MEQPKPLFVLLLVKQNDGVFEKTSWGKKVVLKARVSKAILHHRLQLGHSIYKVEKYQSGQLRNQIDSLSTGDRLLATRGISRAANGPSVLQKVSAPIFCKDHHKNFCTLRSHFWGEENVDGRLRLSYQVHDYCSRNYRAKCKGC